MTATERLAHQIELVTRHRDKAVQGGGTWQTWESIRRELSERSSDRLAALADELLRRREVRLELMTAQGRASVRVIAGGEYAGEPASTCFDALGAALDALGGHDARGPRG